MISGFWQKLGIWPKELIKTWQRNKKWIWFHAVSVGELNAIWPLVLRISELKNDFKITISCTTKAGYNLALERCKPKGFTVFYFPFDIPFVIDKILNLIKPKLLIITETEIWPFILSKCKKRGINTLLVNARLSDKSFKNYMAFRFIFKNIINNFTYILAQSENDKEKFIKLGANIERIKNYGNLKFASFIPTNEKEITDINLGENKNRKIIFASTHPSEEELAIETYIELLKEYKNISLIIAPRHVTRVGEIGEKIKKSGFKIKLRSKNEYIKDLKDIYILDSIGELSSLYKICDITILCGTFAKIGGHNILEPISSRSYTIIGPNDFKIKELSEEFKKRNALIQVNDLSELIVELKKVLDNNDLKNNTINNGLEIIKNNENILKRVTEQIIKFL